MNLKGSYDYVPKALNEGLHENEKIKLVLRTMKQGDFFRLAGEFDRFKNKETGKIKIENKDMPEFVTLCRDVFNDQYIKKIENLTIDDVKATPEMVIDHPKCFSLVCEVTMKIFEISGLEEEEGKNSERASGMS